MEFVLEVTPWGHTYVALLDEWEAAGRPDPLTGRLIAPGTMPVAARRGPGSVVHFYYGVTPSGAPVKLIVSQKEDSKESNS